MSISVSTLVLDEAEVASFGRLLVCLAGVMAGDDRADELLREAAPLRARLELSRLVNRIWDAARTMVNQRTSRVWSSRHRADEASRLGLLRPADNALVGLLVVKQPKLDPGRGATVPIDSNALASTWHENTAMRSRADSAITESCFWPR